MIYQEIEKILYDIRDRFIGIVWSKKTMDMILNTIKSRLNPDWCVKIKCDYENNPPDFLDSNKILCVVEFLENNKYYKFDLIIGDTISIQEHRDRQLFKILN